LEHVVLEEHEREAWLTLVRAARAACRQGRLEKVVTARRSERVLPAGWRIDMAATLDTLSTTYPSCTVFALRWPTLSHTFLGATPETLARVDRSTLHTVALAGTLPHPGSSDALEQAYQALLTSDKLRHEHRVVVEAITDALTPWVIDLGHAQRPEMRVLSNVVHLETAIRATLRREARLVDVLDALHPTPVVGGLPVDEAMAWLGDREDLDRAWYASPLGWLRADGSGHVVVGLRSAWVGPRSIHAYVGAGVTAASNPEDEWHETQLKLEAIMGSLRAAPCKGAP